MTFDELKEKALSLPYAPGVYIMRDKSDTVIYVGKAKKLKNRVSQYFQDTASHTPKTRMMVSRIHHFDVIIAASEFEALILECSLIKRYMPKYNILLKDDKGYPFLRLDMRDVYPEITVVSKIADDGAQYFGPFGSRGTTFDLLRTIRIALKLPSCGKQFPQDIGKDRPCLNYHMNLCRGWCRPEVGAVEYRETIEQARQMLSGNYRSVADDIRGQMLAAADELKFELAASLRDRLKAIETLGQKQLVTAGTLADTDVVGYAASADKACFTVLHFSGGNLLDKDYEIFSAADDREEAVSSLLKQYYLSLGIAPRRVLLPFPLDDSELFSLFMEQKFGRRPHIHVPQRGDNMKLVELACQNALEEAARQSSAGEKVKFSLVQLGEMLAIPLPVRIESYDISHISGTDIVASMIVFENGKPHKSDYRRFKLENMDNQDDYASMRQVLTRRFRHFLNADSGFEVPPDLLLIDGGTAHANVAEEVLAELKLRFPVFGMVKDDRHRTRALVTAEGAQIDIANNTGVFALVGNIQEETHRFAITYHRTLRSKRLRNSELDAIPGIGPKRKQELLKQFKSVGAIRQASVEELCQVVPVPSARNVFDYFHKDRSEGGETDCGLSQVPPAEHS